VQSQSNVGPPYLLPSFVGALLGSTAFRLARVNVWGAIVAVVLLSVGIAGIEQMGSAFYVEPLFNGTTLLIAVGLAGLTSRRQKSSGIGPPNDGLGPGPLSKPRPISKESTKKTRNPDSCPSGVAPDRFSLLAAKTLGPVHKQLRHNWAEKSFLDGISQRGVSRHSEVA
jgi:hypothetical protein